MATSSKKKPHSSALIVSTRCSSFRSFSLCRGIRLSQSKTNPSPPDSDSIPIIPKRDTSTPENSSQPPSICSRNGREAARIYWKKAQQLEDELDQLDKWVTAEKTLRNSLDRKNGECPSDHEMEGNEGSCFRTELVRMADGGYIYRTMKFVRPHCKLIMQLSAPAIIPVEVGSEISQVLNRMALMGTNNLHHWLLESLPMCDLCGDHEQKINESPASQGAGNGFMEAIVVAAIQNFEILVLEGMRIQMGRIERAKKGEWEKRGVERLRECVVVVILIQMRDAEKGNEAFGEIMIGLVEASIRQAEGSKIVIEGVHVAGMGGGLKEDNRSNHAWLDLDNEQILGKRRDSKGGKDHLWSVSLRTSEVKCSTTNHWDCVRNPDVAFAS